MRRSVVVLGALVVCVAAIAAAPAAQARHGVGLFGVLTHPLRAIGFPRGRWTHLSRRHHRALARASIHTRHHNAPLPIVAASLQRPDRDTPAPVQSSATEARPAAPLPPAPSLWPNFDPEIYADLVGYALWPQRYADRFWTHGSNDILDAIVRPSTGTRGVAGHRGEARFARAAAATRMADMVGAGEAANAPEDGICGLGARDRAARPLDLAVETLQLTDPQRAALDKLRAALLQEIDSRRADCPATPPATAVERLKAMKSGLWSVRNVGIYIRTPLNNFYETLSSDQKARLRAEGPATKPRKQPPVRVADGVQGNIVAPTMCGGGRAALTEWPAQAIAESIGPTGDQQASLEKLRAVYGGLSQALMASCPSAVPPAALERLDAADARLLSLASAAKTMNAALIDFYGRLTDDQKQRFNLLRR
jgi:hypothetical protein